MATPLPENDAAFEVSEIVAVTGGRLEREGVARVQGIATDTRGALAGKAFVALVGERFDAHDLVQSAAEAGARCLIVERDVSISVPDTAVVRVPSTLDALGALARAHRRRWGGTVVAIAGSAGKTTTRSTVGAVLGALRPGRVHATVGNLNNQVGLPLTLLAVRGDHELCVLEVGTNRVGEVPALARVCEPDVALLTLVDLEHSEGLGGLDSIEAEEGALLAALDPAGAALGNGDDPRVRRQVQRSPASARLLYGTSEDCDYRLLERELLGHDGVRVTAARRDGSQVVFECPLVGEPGALAAIAAWTVAEWVERRPVDGALLTRALGQVGEAGRLARVVLGDGCLVLDDSYNANPASVRKSVETARELADARGGRLWLVLGEMRELGAATEPEHRAMGELAARSGASGLFVIGSLAEPAVAAASDGGLGSLFFEDAADVAPSLLERLGPEDVVLVKASRGVRAERVVEGLTLARGKVR
ncbi:MAG: UDP-N-acetylmuramoyl-tripeptide--D-alanyl-D-alanine ligase [Myxococcales bacterium]|jgi:UDP-N-acetylmuramoyl-tripeptide--D-alanyl-D-alanine ligase|nr:UDP-N-acetylmuramoyl-tripeptide--D-alanyl-D-alanine ligase [Myxococcales bacterium]